MDIVKELLQLANDTGFVLFFAVFMLLRHDKSLGRLAHAVEQLAARITAVSK